MVPVPGQRDAPDRLDGPADGSPEYLNDRFEEYTGLPAAEVNGESWLNVLHPDDRERTIGALDGGRRGGQRPRYRVPAAGRRRPLSLV